MPLIRRFRALSLLKQVAAFLAAALIVIGGLIIAVVALATAHTASDRAAANSRKAKEIAQCINAVLADRNGPSARDAAAHIAYARADKRAADALLAVLTLPSGSQAQLDAYDRFVVAFRAKKTADAAYVATLVGDQASRNAKPFGKC